MLSIIIKLADSGAQGVVLGCTEIGLLISQNALPFPFLTLP
jgi:aspartate/glutamate racemase